MVTKAEVVEWLRYRHLNGFATIIDVHELENDEFENWKESEELKKADI